jgi:hypothetical protein
VLNVIGMNPKTFLPAIPAIACLALAAPAVAATPAAVSENWAGYAAAPTTGTSAFSAVSGGWTEPKAACTAGQDTYSAFWVGLGGASEQSQALEQAGTQADCTAAGAANYYAWYELVPSAPVRLGLKISPGDSIYARVAVSGDEVTIYLSDRTTGQSVTRTVAMTTTAPDTSTAEWIAEAPSECSSGDLQQCTPLPLTDFGTIQFHNADATAGGHTGSISAWSHEAISLSPNDGEFLGGGYGGYGAVDTSYAASSGGGASPSSLQSKGTAFTVSYGAQASSGSSATGGSYGYGGDPYGDPGYGYGGYGGYGYGGYGYRYGGYGYGGYGY